MFSLRIKQLLKGNVGNRDQTGSPGLLLHVRIHLLSPLPLHHLKEEWSNLEGERNRVRILGNLRNGKLMTWNEHLSEMAFFSFDSPTVMMTYKAAFKPQDFAVLWKKKFHPDLKPRPFRPPELGTTSPTLLPPHLQKLSLKQFLSKNN